MIALTFGALLATATPVASIPATLSAMPGVWSLGETRNCQAGPAWVFLAEGYYAEVKLPDAALLPLVFGATKVTRLRIATATCRSLT